jgi:anti-sigma factor RsiW
VLGERLVDVASNEPEVVEYWLRDSQQQAGPVRNLTAAGFELEGARIEYLADIPKAAIIYKRNGRPITLIQSLHDDAAPLAMRGHHNGYHVRMLGAGVVTYVLVSDLAPRELDLMESALRPAQPELKTDARAAIQ